MQNCPQCGSPIEESNRFCPACGARLTDDDTATDVHPIVRPGRQGVEGLPLLVVVRGANAGSRFACNAEVTSVGRHPDSTVFLDDVTVSRRHAEVRRVANGWMLHDVGSLNGTYLNQRRVEAAELHEGDQIQIGKYKLMFVVQDGGES